MSTSLVRFSARQRLEHVAVMVTFTVLCLTGLPQKFHAAKLSAALVQAMGGIAMTRLLHRWAGIAFAVLVLVHLAFLVQQALARRVPAMSIVPNRGDFADAVQMLRYYLGFSKAHPRFGRFDYRQKFEYWGMLLGSLIMVGTGFVLYFPTWVSRLLPGELIPASKIAHSNEGLMAFLTIIVWHVYNAHLSPDVFPFDSSIFTGRISRERMEKEHPLELARLEGQPPAQDA